jgi:hypothetical protein
MGEHDSKSNDLSIARKTFRSNLIKFNLYHHFSTYISCSYSSVYTYSRLQNDRPPKKKHTQKFQSPPSSDVRSKLLVQRSECPFRRHVEGMSATCVLSISWLGRSVSYLRLYISGRRRLRQQQFNEMTMMRTRLRSRNYKQRFSTVLRSSATDRRHRCRCGEGGLYTVGCLAMLCHR